MSKKPTEEQPAENYKKAQKQTKSKHRVGNFRKGPDSNAKNVC